LCEQLSGLKDEISVLKQQKILLESQVNVQKDEKKRFEQNIKELKEQLEQVLVGVR
jgi:predicted  nucleic acid-binding Zn-ribbon protein